MVSSGNTMLLVIVTQPQKFLAGKAFVMAAKITKKNKNRKFPEKNFIILSHFRDKDTGPGP